MNHDYSGQENINVMFNEMGTEETDQYYVVEDEEDPAMSLSSSKHFEKFGFLGDSNVSFSPYQAKV